MPPVHVGRLDDFPDGRGKAVSVKGIAIAVFRFGRELYAIHDLCPHKRLPLHSARDVFPQVPDDNNEALGDPEHPHIHCPWHHMRWELSTGENPPTGKRLPTYDVSVDKEGKVYIDV